MKDVQLLESYPSKTVDQFPFPIPLIKISKIVLNFLKKYYPAVYTAVHVVLDLVRTGVCTHTCTAVLVCIPRSIILLQYSCSIQVQLYRDLNLDLHPTSTRVPTTMVVVETMVETSPRGLAKARSTPE